MASSPVRADATGRRERLQGSRERLRAAVRTIAAVEWTVVTAIWTVRLRVATDCPGSVTHSSRRRNRLRTGPNCPLRGPNRLWSFRNRPRLDSNRPQNLRNVAHSGRDRARGGRRHGTVRNRLRPTASWTVRRSSLPGTLGSEPLDRVGCSATPPNPVPPPKAWNLWLVHV